MPLCLPAVPCVDVVVGVVGHEGHSAICQGVGSDTERLAQQCAAGDAATLGEDVVCEDGEVLRDEGVLGVVEGELVEAAGASLAIEEAVGSGGGGDVSRADAAMIGDADAGGCHGAAGGGLYDPFAIFGAQLDGGASRYDPADGSLRLGGHGEVHGGIVSGAGGEVVEVVCAGEPEGLWLQVGGGEHEAGLVEACEGGVPVASVEGTPGPVVCGEGAGEW